MLTVSLYNNKDLLKVLNVVTKIIHKNINNDLLNKVLFEKNENKLRVIASNENTYLQCDLETKNIKGDSIMYDNKTLLSLLSNLNGEVEINNGVIKNNKCKYKINYNSQDDEKQYPKQKVEELEYFEVDINDFKKATNNVQYSTSKVIGTISGIYANKNEIVATDGQRLSICKLNTDFEDAIIPKFIINELLKLPFGEKVKISTKNNKIAIFDENIFIKSSTISGKFPLYNAFLPKKPECRVYVNTQDFQEAINMLVPIYDEKMITKLKISNNIEISTQNKNEQEGSTNFNILPNSDIIEKEIKFNGQFLLDMLKITKEEIEIVFYQDSLGVGFYNQNTFNFIMPITK